MRFVKVTVAQASIGTMAAEGPAYIRPEHVVQITPELGGSYVTTSVDGRTGGFLLMEKPDEVMALLGASFGTHSS